MKISSLLSVSILLIINICCCIISNAQVSTDNSPRQKNINADNILLSVFETGDVSKLDVIISPDFVNHAGTDKAGLDSLKAMVKGFHARVPNVKLEVVRQFSDDQYVADWVRFSGSNSIVIEGMEVTRYANGKAVEHWFFSSSQNKPATVSQDTSTSLQKKYQAKAPKTQPFGREAFAPSHNTTVRWLGMAGFLINSRGTTLMIDPLLKGFDMPVMIDFPIKTEDVPKLDAILVTHSDNDHYSVPTNSDLRSVTRSYHSTHYVDSLMKSIGLPSFGHNPYEKFKVGSVTIELTPADHAWQNAYPGTSKRTFKNEDCTGFLIKTQDGTIWATGDSRLMPEHLTMTPPPDAIFFDFSDSEWHFTFEGAVRIANAYPDTPLLLCHWGSVDAPDFAPFNGDPEKLKKHVVNPERIHVVAPGQSYMLSKLKKPSKN